MSEVLENQILKELKSIKKEIDFIKDHMVDVDSIMTEKEQKRFDESLKEYKDSKTTSLEDLKKELGI